MNFVAVTQRVDRYPELHETRDAIDHRLIRFLLEVGLTPVPVPNSLCRCVDEGSYDLSYLAQFIESLDPIGFVLSGGNDIGTCEARDYTEGYILDRASEFQLPVLGICRGMQMMATWANAKLKSVSGHVGTRHRLSGEVTREVNSFHTLALVECPPQFVIFAMADDGEIEGIRHRTLPWQGWMWHPEREETFSDEDLLRAGTLFLGNDSS